MSDLAQDDRAEGETRGVDGATLPIKGPSRDAATVVFTREQIDDYCEQIENFGPYGQQLATRLVQGAQIIRQLQEPVLLNPEVAIGIRGE